jgi:chromosome segregation protein
LTTPTTAPVASGAQFTEIAVKRVLTRDGTSSYYINNQPVRRRDVQDVFLGTGPGPARLRHHRPGHHQPHHRVQARGAAPVPRRSRRRLQIQGAPPRDRKPPAATRARTSPAWKTSCASSTATSKSWKSRPRSPSATSLQADVTLKQHQLWYLKRAEAEADQARVKPRAGRRQRPGIARGRPAPRRGDLETIRQAHYAAGDQVNQAQGLLYEASAEVGRLEAEIRFVVKGRQRVEQRLVQLKEQVAQWATRRDDAWPSRNPGGPGVEAEEKAELLAAQVEEQAMRLPDLEDALRQAQARPPSSVPAWPGAAADPGAGGRPAQHRRTKRQLTPAPRKLSADRNALAAPGRSPPDQPAKPLRRRQEAAGGRRPAARAAGPGAPCWTKTAAPAAGRCEHPGAAARPTCRRAWRPSRRCRKRSRPTASSSPGWPSTAWTACRACGAASTSNRAGKTRSKLRCASAWARWKWAGWTWCGFRAPADAPAGQAGVLQPASGHACRSHGRLPRLADLLRLNDAGQKALLADWLHGCYTAPSFEEALAARDQLAPGK